MQTTLDENSVSTYRSDATNLAAVSASAVSWGAIFAGAAAAAGLSLILLILGAGLGFATTSPWSGEGISATTFGVSTILWVIFMAFAASAIGGYIAGRLRTKWVGVHTNEVYFRDTAHGFLAWSVATLANWKRVLITLSIHSFVANPRATPSIRRPQLTPQIQKLTPTRLSRLLL